MSEIPTSSPHPPISGLARLVFDYTSDAILYVRLPDLTVEGGNARLEEMTGFSVRNLVGRSADKLFPRERCYPRKLGEEVLSAAGLHEDVCVRRADDHPFFASIAVAHAPMSDSSSIAICILRDETERMLLQRELITKHSALRSAHQQLMELNDSLEQRNREYTLLSERNATLAKHAALGEFTAGVAHSINNPLGALLSNCRQAERVLQTAEPTRPEEMQATLDRLRTLLGREREAALRIKRVVEKIRQIQRNGKPQSQRRPTNLSEQLKAALVLSEHHLEYVDLRTHFESLRVMAYPDELQYLFSNLLDNALVAIRYRGSLSISMDREGGSARVVIEDDGPGFQDLDSIFEPFASGTENGTGLGLSISLRIVQRHDGTIRAENRPEGGARLTVELPLVPEQRES